jgi:hypothetical protein
MPSLKDQSDALYREEVARARAMAPDEKLLEGPRLFERACGLMLDGLRHQHPELDEKTLRGLLVDRLEQLDDLER